MPEDRQKADRQKDGTDKPGVPAGPPAGQTLSTADPFVLKVESGLANAFAYCGHLSEESMAAFATYVRLRMMVAFSGGPDSTALLGALVALKEKMAFSVTACHVNHHTRGEASDQDEATCRAICADWEIPLDVRHLSPPVGTAYVRPSESSLRESRYDALIAAAHDAGAHFVLVGHTLDDQIETMLFRLFRGTGLAGLIGMEPARRLSPVSTLLRPLLSASRSECLKYTRRLGVEPSRDASNDDLNYARNYIRHRIIPSVEERFPGFQGRLEQLRQRIAAEELLLSDMTEEADRGVSADEPDTWHLLAFKQLATALQRRLVARALKARDIEVTFPRVTSILDLIFRGGGLVGSRLSLNARWDVRVDSETVVFIDKDSPGEWDDSALGGEQVLKLPGLTVIPALGRAMKIENLAGHDSGRPLKFPEATAWEALVDLTACRLPLVLRARRPGDLIRPFGMSQVVKLKKFLHNHKPPTPQLQGPLMLVADQEEVIWVPGVGLSNRVRVTSRPTHRMSWILLAQDEIYYS